MEFNPEVINIRTALDEHGSALNIDRIIGEDLYSYKLRLLEANVNKASSTYDGLINGITRELGLLQERAFRVNLKALYSNALSDVNVTLFARILEDASQAWVPGALVGLGLKIDKTVLKIVENDADSIRVASGNLLKFVDSGFDYEIVAYNPLIEVDGNSIYLYKDFFSETNYRLDRIIDLRTDNTFFSDVIDQINASTYFSVDLPHSDASEIFAWSLKKQKTIITVTNEVVPATKNFHFENNRIIENSIRFSERGTFRTEVDEEDVSSAFGNYAIDYAEGFVLVNSLPSGNGTVSYKYSVLPADIMFSPVVVSNFKDASSQQFMFNQREKRLYTSVYDRFVSGLPKPDTIENIYELLNVTPLAWGE